MKKINYRLLLFELLFAISLVCVHMPLMPKVINSLGRGAVIFFFFISSYFYQKTLEKEDYTYLKTIKKCLRLLLIEVVVYALYLAVMPFLVIKHTGVTPALFSEFSFTNLMDFFKVYVPNSSFLWFINALIICYLLMPFISKIKVIHNPKFVIVPIVILLLNYVYRAVANVYDLGFFSDRIVTRNFLFTGLPCFLIGIFIKEHIIEKEKFEKFPFWLFCIICLCLLCFSILESYIHKLLGIWPAEFYLSSVVLAAIIYIYAIYYPKDEKQ